MVSDDLALLAAWREGDRGAGNQLVERHLRTLYSFFRTKVDGEVDELIQRTFLACVESRDKFRGEASFRTYLFAVARNEVHGYYRRRDRRSDESDLALQSVADLGTSPSGIALRHAEHRLLLEALRSIPLDYQIALELFYWENMTGGELAVVLGVPEGTARTRINRGRAALNDALVRLADSSERLESTTGNLDKWAQSLREYLCAEGVGPL